jgi:tetraacyldisaccharide 4'-kinase
MFKLKDWYINFIDKKRRSPAERIIYFFLFFLSLIYAAIVTLRNFLYNKGLLRTHRCAAKVISIGNLSWGGTGKTTLSLFLYDRLTPFYKTAVLRRGYGADEGKLLAEKKVQVFASPNRVGLTDKLSGKFELFILDDGFQYRKLSRDINIVIMSAKELKARYRLIPAGFFREPLSSLRRADILILNHKNELNDADELTTRLNFEFRHLQVYTAQYNFRKLTDINGNEISLETIKNKKLAALTGTGYPQGFFNKLEQSDVRIFRKIIYPDHYTLNADEFKVLQDNLIKDGIYNVIITAKDKYHLPESGAKLNFFIFEIEMEISEENSFISSLKNRIK